MPFYTKEEQIAQLMAYMKKVKESGETCGLMDDLQHVGEDGTDWRAIFSYNVVSKITRAGQIERGERSECDIM